MELEGKARNIVRRRKDNIMMNDKQRAQVYNILLTPIEFFSEKYKESNEYPDYIIEETNIFIDKNVIKSTQSYYPYYPDLSKKRYPFSPDCDMSDFACGFYEILYKDILNDNKLVDDNGNFVDKNFAGDTMNSVSKLPILKDSYHCLANFWLIPMHIGRTSKSTPIEKMKWSKMSNYYDIQDFMDRFLLLLKHNFGTYKDMYKQYFKNIKAFEQFADIHFLKGSHTDEKYDIREYSHILDKTTTDTIYDFMKKRAKAISESKHAEELWEYFFENGLLGYKETYLELDEYPLNKEVHPYSYECPKCNRIIANDENYSIPPVCDECAIEG